jgi:hypothetical protein
MPVTTSFTARRRWLAILAALACAVGLSGLGALTSVAQAGTSYGPETRPFEPGEEGMAGTEAHSRSNAPSRVPSSQVPRPATLPVTGSGAKRIEGLTLQDQRDSNGGNSFSLEPPDQGLCVGGTPTAAPSAPNNQVIEGVNDVFRVYDKSGAAESDVTSYDVFFNNDAEIDRSVPEGTPGKYGPFVSDPKCYWDPANGHFYMTILELGTDSTTGDFDGTSFVDLAVTKGTTASTDPADWYLYQIDVANSGKKDTTSQGSGGNLASHAGCPCLGDQPLIGADANGFFITTNEFSIEGPQFNGAQIYALDKDALTTGTLKVQRIETDGPAGLPLAEGTAYSVQPATSPVAAEWSSEANGTEYALSALDFTAKLDNRIASWAFTNTASLRTTTPAVRVTSTVLGSEVYGQPPAVQQKAGPYPLGQSLKDKLNLLNSNDDRMQQVVYSGGRTWSGLNTVVKTSNGPTTTGIAYFVVRPRTTGTGTAPTTSATITKQGYVAVNRNSVMFPSIGVSAGATKAAMVFTLAGPGYYPSTGYVSLSPTGDVASPVSAYGLGTKPADGFTGYPEYGGNGVERWGDYSAAVADTDGTVWMAAEYIPGTFGYPPYLANWGTAIGAV